jgi:type III secretion protein J
MKHIILIALFLLLCGCKEPLFTKLKEEHANEMISILLRNGIDVDKTLDKKDQTLSLLVSKSDIPVALSLLKKRGYPRETYKKIIDIFDKQGLISSPMEERVRFIYALTQEVQETLSQIDGVITARVHIVLPKNDPFTENVNPSSASIFIKYLPGSNLEDIKSDIKFIVERSIEGLKYEKISIVMLPAKAMLDQNDLQWNNILGVRLPADSVGTFRLVLGILLTALLIAIASIVFLLMRLGKSQQTLSNEPDTINPSDINVNNITDNGSDSSQWGDKMKQSVSSTFRKLQ